MKFLKVFSSCVILGSLVSCAAFDESELVPEQEALKLVQNEIPIAANICMQEMLSFGSARGILQKRGYFHRYSPGRKLNTYIKDAPPHHTVQANHTVTIAIRERDTSYECEFWGNSAEDAAFEKAIKRELSSNGFKPTGSTPALQLVRYSKGSKTIDLIEGTELGTDY